VRLGLDAALRVVLAILGRQLLLHGTSSSTTLHDCHDWSLVVAELRSEMFLNHLLLHSCI
jgi:hypothetical protein